MDTTIGSTRRNCIFASLLALALAGVGVCSTTSAQQPWPAKPVKIIIPFGPGSATDIVGRAVAEELHGELGQPFVVENRAGANGFIAAEAVARSASDGYTLFIATPTATSINQLLFKKLPYDPVRDFAPVGNINEGYYFLAVPASLPVNSTAELVAYLKANPGKASYGWGATVSQVAGATFLKDVGATATGVAYKSSPQAVTDLISGQLTFMVLDVTSGLAHVRSDRVRALMVSAQTRVPQMPNVPTAKEAGMPGFDAVTFIGMLAPAGIPDPIMSKLNAALQKILRKPALAERMDACCSARMVWSTAAEFGEYLRKDRAYWAIKVNALGIQPE